MYLSLTWGRDDTRMHYEKKASDRGSVNGGGKPGTVWLWRKLLDDAGLPPARSWALSDLLILLKTVGSLQYTVKEWNLYNYARLKVMLEFSFSAGYPLTPGNAFLICGGVQVHLLICKNAKKC